MRTRVIVQRVAVHWTSRNRGARAATLRRNLPWRFPPPTGEGDLLHSIAMWDRTGYRPQESVQGRQPHSRPWGLRLREGEGRLSVSRTSVFAAFPQRWPRPLFELAPGEMGLYRANFRFTKLSHESEWWYADWILRVGYGVGPQWPTPVREVDDRVSLYGN